MQMRSNSRLSTVSAVALSVVGGCLIDADHAIAQEAAGSEIGSSEIIVTARRRAETEMDVPVAVTALGAEQLERYATKDLGGLATRVPSLLVAQVTGGSGGSISLRGVSSSATNPSIDQAVAINMDGVQLGSAYMVRLAQIDLQQVEVLKGPQALFFGKNSPGGVISYTSVDPGASLQGYVKLSHEFKAQEYTGEAAIGGPLTDTLGARVTVFGTTMKGDRINKAPTIPELHAFGPDSRRAPERDEFFVRGTLVFEPSSSLKVRAKYNYGHLKGSSPWHTGERIYCPNGAPAVAGAGPLIAVDDCKANGVFYLGRRDPALTAPYAAEFGKEGTRTTQQLASLEVDYELAPSITATSISGYYKVSDNTYGNSFYAPVSFLISGTDIRRRDLTQEVRIASDRKEWPVNFTIGGFYQNTKFSNATPVVADRFATAGAPLGTPQPFFFAENFVDTEAYSFFGQAMWKITDKLELAGGARWSHEKKQLTVFNGRGYGGGQFFPGVDEVTFSDTSPEATLAWRPTTELMVFGAFRNGFKSGGFNTSGNTATLSPDQSYRPEDAQGFEFGVKVQTRTLRLSATAYTYKYKNMQVSTFDPIRVAQLVTNAASARIKGIEAEINWQAPVAGLNLFGTINYNHARYIDFLVGCYTGQTIGMGCNLTPNVVTGRFQQQDFSGRQLYLAPDLAGSAGFSYSTPVGDSLKISLSGDALYRSSYFADLEQAPGGKQRESWMFNASVRVGDQDDRWELAFIGENLTQVYRSSLTAQVSLTGISSRTGTNLAGGLSDLNGQINRGRQMRAQFTYRFR